MMNKANHTKPDSGPGLIAAALIIWVIACAALYAKSGAAVLELRLGDPDNYMRFVQVYAWLDGAAWTDLHVARINPPSGMDSHWSRLVDVPLAAVIAATEPWLGRQQGTIIAAFLVPMVLLLAALLVCGWLARPLLGRFGVPVGVLMAGLALPFVFQFAPGRVDHHGWQLILTGLSSGALLRQIVRPGARAPMILAGVVSAFSLWIGAEGVPWVAAFNLALVLTWILRDAQAVDSGLRFAVTLFVTSAILLLIARAPSTWFTHACDSFSFTFVGISGAVLLFWGGLRLGVKRVNAAAWRLALAAVWGLLVVGLFLLLFPECWGGPYAHIDPTIARIWLGNVSEAQPLSALPVRGRGWEIPYWISAPLIAFIVMIVQLRRARGRRRSQWIAIGIYLIVAGALASLQLRMLPFAHMFAFVPLAWLVDRIWWWIGERWSGWRRMAAILGTLLVFGPFIPMSFLWFKEKAETNLANNTLNNNANKPLGCDIRALADVLQKRSDPKHTPEVIAAFFNPGAEILFRTPHAVIGANYHRNTAGNLVIYRLFSAPDHETAREILRRHNVRFILVCPGSTEVKLYRKPGQKTWLQRLLEGDVPPWLRPVPERLSSGDLLFRTEIAP